MGFDKYDLYRLEQKIIDKLKNYKTLYACLCLFFHNVFFALLKCHYYNIKTKIYKHLGKDTDFVKEILYAFLYKGKVIEISIDTWGLSDVVYHNVDKSLPEKHEYNQLQNRMKRFYPVGTINYGINFSTDGDKDFNEHGFGMNVFNLYHILEKKILMLLKHLDFDMLIVSSRYYENVKIKFYRRIIKKYNCRFEEVIGLFCNNFVIYNGKEKLNKLINPPSI